MRLAARETLARVTGEEVPATDPPSDTAVGDGIVLLERVHRFGSGIAELAAAVRTGDADTALALLRRDAVPAQTALFDEPGPSAAAEITWVEADVADAGLAPVRDDAVAAGRAVLEAAAAGDSAAALAALARHRVLCTAAANSARSTRSTP